MNYRPQARFSILAFTLIELLTVITIIAILMGLLFPAIAIVKEQVRKAEAKSVVSGIAGAVRSYYSEYGKYPVGDYSVSGNDLKVGDKTKGNATDDNDKLFNVLRARTGNGNSNDVYNPRKIVFYEGKVVTDTAVPKGGFLDNSGNGTMGALYDPWGKQYVIIMDTNYNDVINLQGIYSDFNEQSSGAPSDTGARTGVGVFSLGKDGEIGSPKDGVSGRLRSGSKISDDITSFQ